MQSASLITPEQIAAIEPLIGSYRRDLARLKKKMVQEDRKVADALRRVAIEREQAARLAKEQEQRERYVRIRARSAIVRTAIARTRQASTKVRVRFATLSYDNSMSFRGFSSGEYSTLKASSGSSLLRWRDPQSGDVATLAKTYRYLMIHAETGRLGWAAFFETQISKIAHNLSLSTETLLRGVQTRLEYELLWETADIETNNIRVVLTCAPLGVAMRVHGYFSLDSLVLSEVDDQSDGLWRNRLAELDVGNVRQIMSVLDDSNRLAEELRRTLLEPFKFEKNSRGGSLRSYLAGSPLSDFWIHLRKIEDREVFVISDSPG
jgi:hypothetical protein